MLGAIDMKLREPGLPLLTGQVHTALVKLRIILLAHKN